jgi:hypothetical protein
VQPRLNQRMIEQAKVFPTGHKHEPSYIGEHGPVAVLPVEAQQRTFWWKVVGRQVPTNGGDPLAQFLAISPVPTVAKAAEPLITVRLRHRCPRPDHFPSLAAPVARSTHVI